jgi:multidrug efflux pump subunit AcrB
MEELAHQVLPKGIGFEWTELAYQQQQRGTPTLLVFGAAALFVFLVLVAQYESWKLPLAIVLIVPMCLLASVTGFGRARPTHRYSESDRFCRPRRTGCQERDPDR